MMTLGIPGLVAAYILVALLLLSLNLYSKWSWRIKLAGIVTVSIFYLVTYFSFPPLLGWPTGASLPRRFNLISAYVREPDKQNDAAGEIYLWATQLLGPGSSGIPRAYRLTFTPELHTRIVNASTKLRKGLPQMGEIRPLEDSVSGKPVRIKRGGQISTNIHFTDIPDPLFPEK